jgi:oligopeptidase A
MAHPFLDDGFHIRWSTLTADRVQEDIEIALRQAEERIELFLAQDRGRMSFDSVVISLDETTRGLSEAWGLVNHLDSLCNTPALREAHNAMLPRISSFFARIPLNDDIWDLLLTYSKTDDARALTGPRRRALDETLESFRQHGAELPPDKKARLEQLETELSKATQKYSENVLDSTNAWELVLPDDSRLAGLPPSALSAARQDALARGHGSEEQLHYRFTLKAPSMIPVLEYAEDDALRREVWEASTRIGREGEHDNTGLVFDILRLRREKAELLGKPHFADQVLQQRMARTGARALQFVDDLHQRVRDAFERETAALEEFRADNAGGEARRFEPWELAFWAERMRRAHFDLDPEELRPYLPMDRVLGGMFELAETIFDIRIRARETVFIEPATGSETAVSTGPDQPGPVEVWHPEVLFYEVFNGNGAHIGSFYADWHPRDSKRGGAWMNYLRMGCPPARDEERRPHLGLICGNMTPPAGGKPALLTHDEVCTVFHEFGHLLHQLMGSVDIPALNGVNVYWDFVELPSQLMENFCWERESLDLFARHHETGEPIPPKLFKKLVAARNFRAATAMMRQLAFAKLDLELHMLPPPAPEDIDLEALTRALLKGYLIPLRTEPPTILRRFGHLFSSPTGYAAGYYSYKWAEVLDADAFTRFQKEGVLNPAVGRAFRDCILSKGNSEDPAKLFRDFMGRDPDPAALLARDGLA